MQTPALEAAACARPEHASLAARQAWSNRDQSPTRALCAPCQLHANGLLQLRCDGHVAEVLALSRCSHHPVHAQEMKRAAQDEKVLRLVNDDNLEH